MIWMPCSAPRLNSKILNFSNNHFGHLTSFLNAKHDDQNQNTLLIKVVTYASVMEKIPSVGVDLLEGVLKALPTSRLQF